MTKHSPTSLLIGYMDGIYHTHSHISILINITTPPIVTLWQDLDLMRSCQDYSNFKIVPRFCQDLAKKKILTRSFKDSCQDLAEKKILVTVLTTTSFFLKE